MSIAANQFLQAIGSIGMPRQIGNFRERAQNWRDAHPALNRTLRNGEFGGNRFLHSMARTLERDGWLTDPQTQTCYSQLSRPANRFEANHIPNGRFLVMDEARRHFRFQIYTVQQGDLASRRLVKYDFARSDRRFKAFATLTNYGRMEVWADYQDQRGVAWMDAADALIHALNSAEFTTRWPDFSTSHNRTIHHNSMTFGIQGSVCCAVCNAETDDQHIRNALCAQHGANVIATNPGVDVIQSGGHQYLPVQGMANIDMELADIPLTPIVPGTNYVTSLEGTNITAELTVENANLNPEVLQEILNNTEGPQVRRTRRSQPRINMSEIDNREVQ